MAVVIGCAGTGGGRLVAMETSQAIPLVLSLKYTEGYELVQGTGINSGQLIIRPQEVLIKLGVATAVAAEQMIAAQFQKAMDDAIYVTPFGDSVGSVSITFIANRLCAAAGTDDVDTSGFDVIQHYLDRRLQTNKNKLPATIVIGSGTFRGFLVALGFNGRSGDLPLTEGTLHFKAWPA